MEAAEPGAVRCMLEPQLDRAQRDGEAGETGLSTGAGAGDSGMSRGLGMPSAQRSELQRGGGSVSGLTAAGRLQSVLRVMCSCTLLTEPVEHQRPAPPQRRGAATVAAGEDRSVLESGPPSARST